jgi:hypothetical protein
LSRYNKEKNSYIPVFQTEAQRGVQGNHNFNQIEVMTYDLNRDIEQDPFKISALEL